MSRNEESRLAMLAALWDGLAAAHSGQSFEERFLDDLKRLGNPQKAFSEERPSREIKALEGKIIQAIREEFSRGEILRLRARLNRSN